MTRRTGIISVTLGIMVIISGCAGFTESTEKHADTVQSEDPTPTQIGGGTTTATSTDTTMVEGSNATSKQTLDDNPLLAKHWTGLQEAGSFEASYSLQTDTDWSESNYTYRTYHRSVDVNTETGTFLSRTWGNAEGQDEVDYVLPDRQLYGNGTKGVSRIEYKDNDSAVVRTHTHPENGTFNATPVMPRELALNGVLRTVLSFDLEQDGTSSRGDTETVIYTVKDPDQFGGKPVESVFPHLYRENVGDAFPEGATVERIMESSIEIGEDGVVREMQIRIIVSYHGGSAGCLIDVSFFDIGDTTVENPDWAENRI